MKSKRWQQIDHLYHAALGRDVDERATFLKQACLGDPGLRHEVESLIASHEQARSFIVEPALKVAAKAMAQNRSAALLGRMLSHYRIECLLGVGGMGEVYMALDTSLNRKVALKLLPEYFTEDIERLRRFEQEARAVSGLNHPNIVTIHEIGQEDGHHFIATEFIEGETLRKHMGGARLPFVEIPDIGIQLALALLAAHQAGIVHRDIKPENIMIRPDGYVKLLDFGLAKLTENVAERQMVGEKAVPEESVNTSPGLMLGTAHYMSPEQTRGELLDLRSDVFSLGVVLYEAATGRPPFNGASLLSVVHEIATVSPLPPSKVQGDLPLEFDLIVERSLAKDKEQRYSSATELADALRRLRVATSDRPSGLAPVENDQTEGARETFVGRGLEMKRLQELLSQAANSCGRVVFITGEPGIGKTTLADEFIRRARKQYPGLFLCRGRCVEQYGTGEAYLPFLEALSALLAGPGWESIAAVLRRYAPTWCLQLPAAFASSGDLDRLQRETIGATKERMLREMGDALGLLAARGPLLILLEDLQWADPSSADLLSHLCHRIGSQSLLIVGTFRPEDLDVSNLPLKTNWLEMQTHNLCEEIALNSLNTEDIASYLNARFTPNNFPRDLAALIQRKTEGHPLFASSLVQFLAEREDIVNVNDQWSLVRPLAEMNLEAPESVRNLLRKKIDVLAEEDKRTLQYASVEGEEFTSTVLAKLMDTNDLDLEERLDRLDKVHRLVQTRGEEELPDGTLAVRYRFAHALYQNVLYGDLVSKRRRLLHRKAGEQLLEHYGEEAPRIATQLAMHFERGRDFARTIQYLIQAGDNAIKLYANAEAERHYSHALDLVEKLATEERSAKYLTLYSKRGRANLALTRRQQSEDDFTRMLDLARTIGAAALECAALNALADTFFYSHRLKEMRGCATEAMQVAQRLGDKSLRIEAMVLLGMAHTGVGELTEGIRLIDEAILTARPLKPSPALIRGLVYRGIMHFFQTEYDRAEILLTEAETLASEFRNGFMLLQSRFFLGLNLGNQGRISEALATLTQAMEMALRDGDHIILGRVPNSLGWLHRELGDFEQAIAYDQEGANIASMYHITEAEANSLINLSHDHTQRSEGDKALAALGDAEAIFERDEWNRWRFHRIRFHAATAEHLLFQGNLERASEHALSLLENAVHHNVPKYVAVAHKLLGEIAASRGNLPEAEAELIAAVTQLDTHPAPLLAWKVYAALGQLRLRQGDDDCAHQAFSKASVIIDKIAGAVNDERLRSVFLNSESVREVLAGVSK
jgi:serine/threonine protein kinase/tetratricopeptide (TPR) repeat protein